jgi:hypothetical protein
MRGICYTIMATGSVLWGVSAVAQYINGPAPPVTADQFCAKFQRFVGSSSDGHSLLSLSCRGGGHDFYLHARIN